MLKSCEKPISITASIVSMQKVSPCFSWLVFEFDEGGIILGFMTAITVPDLMFLAGRALSLKAMTEIVL